MPHKHKRSRLNPDASQYDLPPTKLARALPVTKSANPEPTSQKPSTKKPRQQDDTPRAFTRLLQPYQSPRSGLDDGKRSSKKRKTTASAPTNTTVPALAIPAPQIQPRESLSAFGARVDAALPVSGLSKKSGAGKEARVTKTEKRMQRMRKVWWEEERRLREKREEEESEDYGVDQGDFAGSMKKVKKGKGKRGGGGNARLDEDEDPWASIAVTRREGDTTKGTNGTTGLVGLHDVVQAPPRFTKTPKGTENGIIMKGVIGLKRQVELGEARKSVVEGYREMMREKRGDVA